MDRSYVPCTIPDQETARLVASVVRSSQQRRPPHLVDKVNLCSLEHEELHHLNVALGGSPVKGSVSSFILEIRTSASCKEDLCHLFVRDGRGRRSEKRY